MSGHAPDTPGQVSDKYGARVPNSDRSWTDRIQVLLRGGYTWPIRGFIQNEVFL